MPQILEAGKVLNKQNKSRIRAALEAIRAVLTAAGDFDDDSEDTKVKEAAGFANSDLHAALSREIREKVSNRAMIEDIFDSNLVYRNGWDGGWMQCDYTIDETGVATFGTPIEVSRKVTYVPTSDQSPQITPTDTYESATVELEGDSVALVEKAVSNDGTVMLKLISPGWGSSGYYSTEVLKRDGPNVFRKGLHNYIDHPTAVEEATRPEGTLTKLGSTLQEDAKWFDRWIDQKGVDQGPGLYAAAKVVPDFGKTLDVIATDIGTSIRASGKAHVGEAEGKRGNIVDAITEARSCDYVTIAGRGGKVLPLYESARNNTQESESMTIDTATADRLAKLEESNARLYEALCLRDAQALVESELGKYPQLLKPTRERLCNPESGLARRYTLKDGALDTATLIEVVKTAVTEEMQYIASLGGGSPRYMGGRNGSIPQSNEDGVKGYNDFVESLKALD